VKNGETDEFARSGVGSALRETDRKILKRRGEKNNRERKKKKGENSWELNREGAPSFLMLYFKLCRIFSHVPKKTQPTTKKNQTPHAVGGRVA